MTLGRTARALLLLACACDPAAASTAPATSPVLGDSSAAAPPGPAVALVAGNFHTCAALRDGTVRCWGMGKSGQLGDDRAVLQGTPVRAAGLTDVVDLAAEGERTCAVRRGGDVWCWGLDADASPVTRPTHVPAWTGVRRLALALDHDCAILHDGRVLCRGSNTRGALGDGTDAPRDRPVPVVGLTRADDLGVGYGFSCALQAGQVLCWGWTADGRCGDDPPGDHLVPTVVPGLPPARAITVGFDHACAIADDAAYCWGGNVFGQLGDGTTETRRRPTRIPDLDGVASLRAGTHQTTAILADRSARGWGREGGDRPILWPACSDPQIRRAAGRRDAVWITGPAEPYCPRPTAVPALANTVHVVSSQLHACALQATGHVWCWGSDAYGSLGDPATADRPEPVQVLLR